MSSTVQVRCSPGEYLARERAAEFRSELVDGRMRAMHPNNLSHIRIAGSLLLHLHGSLRRSVCEVYGINMRLKVSRTGLYTYADLVALCGKAVVEDEHDDTLLNPSVIAEVLSEQTEAYDRGMKFWHYRRLDSLREYILVSQDRPHIEKYVRDGDEWRMTEMSGIDASLAIDMLGCTVAFAEIYERVEFPPAGDREPVLRPLD